MYMFDCENEKLPRIPRMISKYRDAIGLSLSGRFGQGDAQKPIFKRGLGRLPIDGNHDLDFAFEMSVSAFETEVALAFTVNWLAFLSGDREHTVIP
jgi:hypothetical protein